MILMSSKSTLFPYTTLFRSRDRANWDGCSAPREVEAGGDERLAELDHPLALHREQVVIEDDVSDAEIDEVLAMAQHRFGDRKSTRLNSSHDQISYAVFRLKK